MRFPSITSPLFSASAHASLAISAKLLSQLCPVNFFPETRFHLRRFLGAAQIEATILLF